METGTKHQPSPLIAAEPGDFAHPRGTNRDHCAQGQALAYLMTSAAVDKLFDTIGPRFGDRQGGYLRIVRAGWRKGDGADTAFVELLGSEKLQEEKREKRAVARSKRAEEAKRAMDEAEAQQGVEHPADGAEGSGKVKEEKE